MSRESRPYPLLCVAQLIGTVAILVLVPSSLAKAFLLPVWWLATFWPIGKSEMVFFVLICLLSTVINALALRQGVCKFAAADVLGMPYFELLMWGFYALHLRRLLGGPAPGGGLGVACGLALLFGLCLCTIANQVLLLVATTAVIGLGLCFFHDRWDLAYIGYMIGVGMAIEYAGVWTGQWSYPDAPWGGVPPWFMTLWGGVGLFVRRIGFSLLEPEPRPISQPQPA